MVMSTSKFYVCENCGFSYSEHDSDLKSYMPKHIYRPLSITLNQEHDKPYNNGKCLNKVLNCYSLHHKFSTDVAKITFSCDTSDYNTMYSVMYALLYAMTDELSIERKDVKACLSQHFNVNTNSNMYSIIIYDAVPGGAGHSRRIVTSDGAVLKRIIEKAINNMDSCSCDPSCYNCLRSYENQRNHDKLDRKKAASFLKKLI